MRLPLLLLLSVFCISFVAVETRSCQQRTTHQWRTLAYCPSSVIFKERQTSFRSVHSHQVELENAERTVVILYHKPPNVITSHSNVDALPKTSNRIQKQRRTVYEDIFSRNGFIDHSKGCCLQQQLLPRSKLHAIGRLDVDTTGLLLLTNDGGLVHHVTNPNSSIVISKTYEAVIMGHWNDTSPAILGMKQHGVDIGSNYGGWTRPPLSLVILNHPTPKSTRVEITICEGKNRQVRRMFHAIQSGVITLKRTRIGNALTCNDLNQGQWRFLTDQEVETFLDWKPRYLTIKNCGDGNHGGRRNRSTVSMERQRRKRKRNRRTCI